MKTTRVLFIAIASLGLAAPIGHATSGTWTNATSNSGWDTGTNWAGGSIPNGEGDSAVISLEIGAARTVSLNGDRTVGALTIGDTGATYYAITLNAGTPSTSRLIFDQTGAANATLTYPVTASNANNTISAPILLNDNLAITSNVTTTGAQSLSGIISDGDNSCSLSLAGGGILTLSGYNTYEGGTTITAGKINANTYGSFGTGPVTVASGGQANLAIATGAYTNSFTIAGNGFAIAETNTTNALGALRYGISGATTTGTITVDAAGARLGAYNAIIGIHLGALTGSGNLEINSSTTNHDGTILIDGTADGLTGAMTLRKGTLKLGVPVLGGSLTAVDGTRLFLEPLAVGAAGAILGSDAGSTHTVSLGASTGMTVFLDPTVSTPMILPGNLTLTGTETVCLTQPHSGSNTDLFQVTGTVTGSAANLDLPGGKATYRAGTGFAVVPGSPSLVQLQIVSAERQWKANASGNWNTGDLNWNTRATETFSNGDNVTFDDFDSTGESITVTIPTALTVCPNKITFNNSTKNYTISGAGLIGGCAAITKGGSGSATISNTGGNNFAGAITVNAGSLYLVPSASLNVNRVTLNGGKLAASSTSALTFNANANVTGTVTLGDSTNYGTLTFNGLHTFSAGCNITVPVKTSSVLFNGYSKLPTSSTISTPFSTSFNSQLTFAGTSEMLGDTTLNTPAAFNSTNYVAFNGRITDGDASYRFIKQGLGCVRFFTANTYDGGTTISGGTIIVGNAAALGTGSVTIENDGQANLFTGGTYTNPFSISGTGQTLSGLNNTSPDGAIQLNTSGIILAGPITLTGNARIGGYTSTSASINGAIGEDGFAPRKLEIGSPGAANGGGTMTLNAANTYSGGTDVARVVLRAYNSGAFGGGDVTISSGDADSFGTARTTRVEIGRDVALAGNATLSNNFTLNSIGKTDVSLTTYGVITGYPGDTNASTATLTGTITINSMPANGGHFASAGNASTSILRLMGPVNSSVPVKLAGGIIEMGGGGSYDSLLLLKDTLRVAAPNGIATNAVVTMGSTGAATLDLTGNSQQLAGLVRAGANTATVTNSTAATAATLTLAPTAVDTFSGTFLTTAGATLDLAVGGTRTVTLNGSSSGFTGTTTVQNGAVLEITGTFGGATSTLVVENGGTLTGTGTIGGNVLLNDGAHVLIDPALGTLTIAGSLTVNGTATIEFVGTPGETNTLFTVNGTMNATNSNFSLFNESNYSSPRFNVGTHQLNLITGVLNLTWTAANGPTWDINTTASWTDGTGTVLFVNGFTVNFTDAPGADQSITVGAAVKPSTLTLNNSAHSYLFGDLGFGQVETNTLTKNGTGRSTFATPLKVNTSLVLNAGTLALASADNGTAWSDLTAALTGTGTLEVAAGLSNPITINAASTGFSGSFVVAKEQVKLGNSSAAGTGPITIGAAATAPTDHPTLTLLTGVTVSNPITVSTTVANGAITGAGAVGGTATLTKDGPGTLDLSTVNSYSGATTILAGTLNATVVGALPSSTTVVLGGASSGTQSTVLQVPPAASADQVVTSVPVSLNASATSSTAILRRTSGLLAKLDGAVALNGRDLHVEGGGLNLAGAISGTGNLVIDAPTTGGAVRLSSASNAFTGNVLVNAGTLQTTAAAVIPDASTVTLGSNAILAVGANESVESVFGPSTSTIRPAGGAVDLTVGALGSSWTFSGALADNGTNNTLNLNKTGTGTLILDGTSTSAGYLRVKGGKVLVNGTVASRLEVDAGCILGGSGTIHYAGLDAGLLPISGRIAPGGAAAVGTLHLDNKISMQTNAGMDIRIADWTGDTPGTTHDHLLCPQVVFSGTDFYLRLDCTGMTNFTEVDRSLVIITGTQALYPPGSNFQHILTTNFPGSGTWRITYSGNQILLNYTAPVAPTGYAAYLANYPSLTGANALGTADPDNDGLDNWIEYVLGTNPTQANPEAAPSPSQVGNNFVFTYQRTDGSEGDTTQIVVWTTDVTLPDAQWNHVAIPASTSGPVTVTENGADPDQVSVMIPHAGNTRIFAKLQVSVP